MIQRAFTLVDLMVTLAIMSIVVLAAIPAFTANDRTRVVAAANLVVADLNNARAMSVQNPANPVGLALGEKGLSYYLALTSDPANPIEMPLGIGGKYMVVFGEGDHTDLWDVVLTPEGVDPATITAGGANHLAFDAFGRLSPLTDVRLVVSVGGESMTIVVRADTGDAFVE